MAVVAVHGALEGRRLAHLGGVRPVVAHVRGGGGDRGVRPVLQRGALVLFALDTTHSQAWEKKGEREREAKSMQLHSR